MRAVFALTTERVRVDEGYRSNARCVVLLWAVPTYRITIVNEHFSQEGEQESADVIEAWQDAIATAIRIAADQVSHGNPFFGAEVTLEEGNKQIGRYLVSVGASQLKE